MRAGWVGEVGGLGLVGLEEFWGCWVGLEGRLGVDGEGVADGAESVVRGVVRDVFVGVLGDIWIELVSGEAFRW